MLGGAGQRKEGWWWRRCRHWGQPQGSHQSCTAMPTQHPDRNLLSLPGMHWPARLCRFTPSKKVPAKCVGPSVTIALVPKVCILDSKSKQVG